MGPVFGARAGDSSMKLFRRKPKKFNYAAIRIGNVYVLPPGRDELRKNGHR